MVARYRKVPARYPQSGYSDDALLALGDLQRAMAKRFKKPALLEEAVHAYETLADEYPSSRHAEEALYAAFDIAQTSGDQKRLLETGRAYMGAFPDSARARVVKAAIKQRAPERAASLPTPPPPGTASLYDLRFWTGDSATRVVIDVERKVRIESDRISNPDRLWIDLFGTRLHPKLEQRHFVVGDGLLQTIRLAHNRDNVVRVVLDFQRVDSYNVFYLEDPLRLVVDVKGPPRRLMAMAPPDERGGGALGPMPATTAPPLPGPAARPRATVVEVVPDADDDVGVDDPGSTAAKPPSRRLPAVAAAPTSPAPTSPAPASPAPLLHPPVSLAAAPPPKALPSPEPAASPSPQADRLPSRRLNAMATAEPPAPTRPKPAPVVMGSPPSPRRTAQATPPPLAPVEAPPSGPVQAPQANRAGSYSLARQLGLGARRIVIDAGHGGHDPGTIGRGGLMEKDLVLDVALRLEKMVEQELRAEVLLTRSSDVFIPLEERTAIANSKGADLFLSIHANASRNARARGIETYFLSFAKNPHAEEVAARENAISAATMKDLQGLVKAITLNSKIDESRDFASSVQEAMVESIRGRYPVQNRGVHQAPFYVLIGANMPSVLAEIAFVSNPEDERLLKTPEYREAVARSLFKGVRAYLESLARPPARALTALPERSRVASGSR